MKSVLLRQIGTCKEHLLDGISVSSHLKEHVLQSAGEDRDHVKATTLVHDVKQRTAYHSSSMLDHKVLAWEGAGMYATA